LEESEMNPEVTRYGALDMQVCVPAGWTDDEVAAFAEREYPSGTGGWKIRRAGALLRNGSARRVCYGTRRADTERRARKGVRP
jgi:hypothetical protein